MAAGLANGEVLLLNISDSGDHPNRKSEWRKPVTSVKFNDSWNHAGYRKRRWFNLIVGCCQSEISQSLTGHQAMVSDLQFSADDLFLLSASYDGTSMLWNMKINKRAPGGLCRSWWLGVAGKL